MRWPCVVFDLVVSHGVTLHAGVAGESMRGSAITARRRLALPAEVDYCLGIDDLSLRSHVVRSKPAHGVLHTPNGPTVVFDTVCVAGRRPLLANDEVHARLRRIWAAADRWLVTRYVIMPDHVHYLAAATESAVKFDDWVRYWKSQWARETGERGFWQADHWDTRMRSSRQLEEKWTYVRRNPLRHELVNDVDEWRYQGTLCAFEWD